jgi:hypothetical protein
VFAAIDCDWPPVVGDAEAEQAWDGCRRRLHTFEARLASGRTGAALRQAPSADEVAAAAAGTSGGDAHAGRVLPGALRSWSKGEHLGRMQGSGRFSWCREVAFVAEEVGDARRYVDLLRSQGDYQGLRRAGLDDADLGVERFSEVVAARLGDGPRPFWFTYRARVGVTPV